MTEREPESGFPGRDTYARPDSPRKREGTNVSLLFGTILVILLATAAFYFFG
jgi:hypothetical protein